MPLIRANHLEDLARTTVGRDQLGELMRRLVYCWAPNRVLGMSFLAGEVNNFPGWDGWLHMKKANGDRVDHFSVWQISVESNAPSKIKRDFKSSLKASLPSGWVRPDTFYVAVTLRKLKNKRKLKSALRKIKGNRWGDIQIIDAIDLEQWIEKCPAVEAWAGEVFGIGEGRFGESLQRRWKRWSGVTDPEISRELVLAGRDTRAVEQGLKFENNRMFAVQADSPEEAVAIVYAVIETLPAASRDRLLSSALVVSSDRGADDYAQHPFRDEMEPLTVLVPPAVTYANRLAKKGHCVVMAFGRRSVSDGDAHVKRGLRSDFEKALTGSMNVSSPQAITEARACGSSVSIWRVWNLLVTADPGDQIPIWAQQDSASALLIPAMLLRAWDDDCQGDREIVAEFTGLSYEKFRDEFQIYSGCDDPLYECAGSVFCLIAPSVAFALFGRRITTSHLTALEVIAKKVFGELEKNLLAVWDAPKEDILRVTEKPKYSTWLRDGLMETLLSVAYLARPSLSVTLRRVGGGQAFVDRLVRELPMLGEDPRMIASLHDQLPYLAEAAPIPFVEALESLLQGDRARIKPLFADRGFFGPAYYSGVLWALETLAWSPEYLLRVSLILGYLDEIDSDNNGGNRPLSSLRDIFLAWRSGTSATIDERVTALHGLYKRHPKVAWKLLISLLPKPHDTASPTHEPTWHDFGRSKSPALTDGFVTETFRKYAETALDLATNDLTLQIDLIDAYPQFPPEYRSRLLTMLNASHSKSWGEHLRNQIWDKLRKMVAHHRSFADAEWALREEDLRPLEKVGQMYLPADVVSRHRWLFNDQWPETGYKAEDVDGNQRDIETRRREAINEILTHVGWDGVHRLIREGNSSYALAIAIAEVVDDDEELFRALDEWVRGHSALELMAIRSLSGIRFHAKGNTWTEELIDHIASAEWPDDVIGNAFLQYPAEIQTFQIVASFGGAVESFYWINCWLHLSKASPDSKRFLAEKYIRHGRAADILDALGRDLKDLGIEMVQRIIGETINQLNAQQLPRDRGMFSYHLKNAFKWLRDQPEVNSVNIARLEYPFLPLLAGLGHEREETLTLHSLLSEDATFFVQVLCDLYKPASKPKTNSIDEGRQSRATAAWRLLKSWKIVPGVTKTNAIDTAKLNTWIDLARELAAKEDRTEVSDRHIGQILYHACKDPMDNAWRPPIAVLEIIEKLSSTPVERGFSLECFNSRGVTSRSPLDGGKQERVLEARWRQQAKALGNNWPRTKAMFNLIADDWNNRSKWHDEDAEKTRMRWS